MLLLSNQIILALHIIVLPSYCLIFDQPTKTCFPQLGKCMEKGNIGKRLPTLDTCGIKHFKVMWCLNFEGVLNKENKYLKSWQILQHNPRVYRWVSGWFGKKYTYTKYTWDLKAVGHSFQKIYDIPWSWDAPWGSRLWTPETPTEWNSESVTDGLTGVGGKLGNGA